MIVLIRGPLLSVTGYGCHTRQIWEWARSKPEWEVYSSIVPWGQCTYYIDPNAEEGIIGDVMTRSGAPPRKPDVSIQVQLPDEWDDTLANKNIGVTAGIEADKCSVKWIDACKKMDRVIVPSEYSKLSFLNGGLEEGKIRNVPEAITCSFGETKNSNGMTEKLDGLSTDFNFLMFGQVTAQSAESDRKNTFNCLKWLCEEFKGKKDVGIVLKTNLGRMTQQDKQATHEMVDNVVKLVRKGDYPRIHVVHGLMDRNEVGKLFTHGKVKALCAPTRGEGWGLPILDAAAAGLPVITTSHSGHMDFMKYVRYLGVEFKLVEIPDSLADGRIWVPGARWAEPAENSFKSRVRKFYKSPNVPTEWAEEAMQDIRKTFNLQSVFAEYDKALGDIIDIT